QVELCAIGKPYDAITRAERERGARLRARGDPLGPELDAGCSGQVKRRHLVSLSRGGRPRQLTVLLAYRGRRRTRVGGLGVVRGSRSQQGLDAQLVSGGH